MQHSVLKGRSLIVALGCAIVLMGMTSEALVLCPQFPSCCLTNSCWSLCPSCREARFFINGVRLFRVRQERCPNTEKIIFPDPYLDPEHYYYPEEIFCFEDFY